MIAYRVAALAAVLGVLAPARYAPGVTYRIRVTTKLPQMGAMDPSGGGGAGQVIFARATSIGSRARFDFTAIEPATFGVSLNDYVLLSDSGKFVAGNPDSQTYRDGSSLLGGGALGSMGSAFGGAGRGAAMR